MKAQRENIRKLFEARPHQPIPVYELAKIALQYGGRIFSLRREPFNMDIQNSMELVNGVWHSCYTYYPNPVKVEQGGQLAMVM